MRNNLIKILAVSTIALTLGACKGKKQETPATEVTVQEALELEGGNWKLAGQKIKVSNLALSSRYGNHFFGAYVPASNTEELAYIEAELTELPTFTADETGYGADITLEGVLTDVNGRPVLKDAKCTVNSERENRKASEGHGLPIYYYNSFTRGQFDYNLDRTTSGYLVGETTFQLADVPELPEGDIKSELVFNVAFPGENLDLEDLDNLSPISVVIPAGLGSKAADALRKTFKDKKAGDFIFFDTYVASYDTRYAGVTFLVEDFWGPKIASPSKNPEVYNTAADFKAAYDPKFAQPIIPQLFNDEVVFSYVPNIWEVTGTQKAKFTDGSFIYMSDLKKSHFLQFNMNVKNETDLVTLVNGIAEYLGEAANGWSKPENGVYTYSDEEGKVTREIVLSFDEDNPTYLTIMYMGNDAA